MSSFLNVLQSLKRLPSERSPFLSLQKIKIIFDALKLNVKSEMIVHVAGTNGKGSTAYYLYQFLKKKYDSIFLYTSPHLSCVRERFLMFREGKEFFISQDDFVLFYQEILFLSRLKKIILSYFEMLTAIAFAWVFRQNVKVSLWEVGLGGRLDATNVLPATHSLITNIALDHQDYLGNDLESILKEKAGIVKKGQVVFSGIQEPFLRNDLEKIVSQKSAQVHFIDFDQNMSFLDQNKALAALFLKKSLSNSEKFWSLDLKNLNGRMQWIRSNICLDGAHNPHAMKALLHELSLKNKKLLFILSLTKGKKFSEIFDIILAVSSTIFLLQKVYSDQMDPIFLKQQLKERDVESKIVSLEFLKKMKINEEEICVLTGSLYPLSTVRKVFL